MQFWLISEESKKRKNSECDRLINYFRNVKQTSIERQTNINRTSP